MTALYFLIAFIAGAVTPLQAGINGALRDKLGHPLHATMANFVGGSIFVALLVLIFRVPIPATAAIASAPWWSWTGGICGVTLVCGSIIAVQKLGYAGLVIGILAGQVVCSLVMDHFGVLGIAVREITPVRLIGVVLVIGGVALIQFTGRPAALTPATALSEVHP